MLGGIPTYNRILCRALNELRDTAASSEKRVLIAMDKPADIARAEGLSNLSLEAFGENRLALIRRAVGLAMRQRIELALIGHVNYTPLAWMLKRMQPRMRYGVILYGIEVWQPLGGLRRRALCGADFLISISEYTKRKAIEQNGLNEDRFYLLPNALEPTVDRPVSPSEGMRMLSVCRFEKTERYKGVDKVIELLPEIQKQVPDIHYMIVGDGSDLNRHKELAERLGVAERVSFMGFLEDEALHACYRDADLFVMPSTGEGFGFVFLEAMQYGKPVVAAACTAVPEVVVDGVSGVLVERNNPAQLLDAIIRLCRDRSLRERMGTAGRERLYQHFTFARFKQTLHEIILRQTAGAVSSPPSLATSSAARADG
jgi:phosphatidylinositol alpha-1,6-mannosyltransferase